MADQDQKLCDNCHERPATNNICYGNGDEGRSLCQICLLQDSEVGRLMQRFNQAVQTGQCKYCSAPAETAFGGSTSFLGDHFNLVCRNCFDDLSEFVRQPDNVNLFRPCDDLAPRDVAGHFADFEKRKDEYMRQRVLARKSKQ